MKPVFNKTFFHFFVGFLAIIAVAFGVITVAGSYSQKTVDTAAAAR